MPSTYPVRDLDLPPKLKEHLGSFWSEIYADQPELDASLEAVALPWRQASRMVGQLIDALAFSSMPILEDVEWRSVTIRDSDRRQARAAGLRYAENTTARYGDGHRYGEIREIHRFPVFADAIVAAPAIFDATYEPTVTLVDQVDYTIDATTGILWLDADPFADARWRPTPIVNTDGEQIDRELTLWFWRSKADRKLLYRRLGYAMGVDAPATTAGRDLLNRLVDLLTQGSSHAGIEQLLALLFDIPLTAADGEIVELIYREARGLVIATDRRCYRYADGATPIVAVGDVLTRNQPLTSGLRIDPLNTGRIPAALPALSLGAGLLSPELPGAVTFVDADLPIQFLATSPPQVRWPVFAPAAVESAFWASVHARGIAQGKVLAEYLDRRPIPVGEPTAASLPATINPLQFLLQNLLRGSALLVRVRSASVGASALGPGYLRLLRRVVPPHVLLIMQIELPPLVESQPEPGSDQTTTPQIVAALIADPAPTVTMTNHDQARLRVLPGISV